MIYTLGASFYNDLYAAFSRKLPMPKARALFILLILFAAIALLTVWQWPLLPQPHGNSGPLVIYKGGTYTGVWVSEDSDVPAVDIRTSEPVILENAIIKSAGILIRSVGYGAHLTIRNTKGYGLTPTPYTDYEKPRRFLAVDDFKNIVVENCYLQNTAGIYIGQRYMGNGTAQQSIKIRYNKVDNIDGRIYNRVAIAQFVQFNYRGEVPHVEIAWNQVINQPNESAVEDNINIYNSRGTPNSPILIHNNYIQGAYPFPANAAQYSGGGIIADSPGTDSTQATAHIKVYDNQLVALGNYCLGIAAGNHIEMFRNRAVVSARFSDSTLYNCWTGGIWAKDYYKLKSTYNNRMHHNVLGVVGQTGTWRNEIMDSTFVAAATHNNSIIQEQITPTLEAQEFKIWVGKVAAGNINLGPQTSKSNLK